MLSSKPVDFYGRANGRVAELVCFLEQRMHKF
jgi:hypothetical protein